MYLIYTEFNIGTDKDFENENFEITGKLIINKFKENK